MRHKYLEDAGIDSYPWNGWKQHYNLKTLLRFKRDKRKYGFDERECFDLDSTLFMILYERLCKFEEDSKGVIDWEGSPKVKYKDREYTVIEMTSILKENIIKYFNISDDHPDLSLEEENKLSNELLNNIFDQLRAVFTYLWW